MKILIVTQTVDLDDDLLGAFHQWIKRFAENFESVEVICLRKGKTDLPANVRVHSLGKEEGVSRLKYLYRFFKYVIALRRDYDCVFVHMNPEYVVLAGTLWRLWGKTTFLWYAHKKGSWLRLLALRIGDRVVSVSKESFNGSDSPKFLAVGHGVDPDVYACASSARKDDVILSVGKLSAVKEYGLLIDAAHLLRTRYGRTDFKVKLVGGPSNAVDEAYVKGLKEKIAALGMDGFVEFAGPMPNRSIVPVLCGAAAFVSMQKIGGAGKSFLEAMSCGVPTIVSTPVFNEHYGEWLPYLYYDWTPEDFAKKLDAVLSLSDAERARMSADLRRIVIEHHNLQTLVRRLKTEYERLRAKN